MSNKFDENGKEILNKIREIYDSLDEPEESAKDEIIAYLSKNLTLGDAVDYSKVLFELSDDSSTFEGYDESNLPSDLILGKDILEVLAEISVLHIENSYEW